MPSTITEIKHRPGKGDQTWTCDVIEDRSPEWIRVRYVSDRDYVVGGTFLPAGTTTEAVYWSARPYHVWRMTSPDGTLLGYRFDVCAETTITPERLEWTDLVLDLWVPAAGEAVWEDGEEFDAATRNGLLTEKQARLARQARSELDDAWQSVVREAYGDDLPAGAQNA